jgi:hypothetical protein
MTVDPLTTAAAHADIAHAMGTVYVTPEDYEEYLAVMGEIADAMDAYAPDPDPED